MILRYFSRRFNIGSVLQLPSRLRPRYRVFLETHQGCHSDRSAFGIWFSPAISGAEWRNREGPSLAMPSQGVLPMPCPGFAVAFRDTGRAWQKRIEYSARRMHLSVGVGLCGWQLGQNSLSNRDGGQALGVPPLRATDFLMEKTSRGAPVGMTDGKRPPKKARTMLSVKRHNGSAAFQPLRC
jgi:hypothetical protein